MTDKTSYQLEIKLLSIGNHSFDYQLNRSFFDSIDSSNDIEGDVFVAIELNKQETISELKICFDGEIFVPCDRCLDLLPLNINIEKDFVLRFDETGLLTNKDELEIDYNNGFLFLAPLFYEEIIVNIPIKNAHKEGECNNKMLEIVSQYSKRGEFDSEKSEIDPRWESLKNISDKLKNS